jgi:hypothetical protein
MTVDAVGRRGQAFVSIGGVLGVRSIAEMGDLDAWRVVTRVEYVQFGWAEVMLKHQSSG